MDLKEQILERLISNIQARLAERRGELKSRQIRALAESIAEELALIYEAVPALVERDIERVNNETEYEGKDRQEGELCPECNEPLYECPSGLVCKNGHGF